MAFWNRSKPAVEARSVTQSASDFYERLGLTSNLATAGVNVTIDTALTVPAFASAVNFLSGTLAGLPCKLYRKAGEGREQVVGGLAEILHSRANDEMSSFEWRKYMFDGVFTGGRAFTYIERNNAGRIVNLWPLDPSTVTVTKSEQRRTYTTRESGRSKPYRASEILDIPFMLKADMVSHRGPVGIGKEAIGMAISATRYGAKAFQKGGIPPATLEGPFATGAAAQRASEDVAAATMKLSEEGKSILALPLGHSLKGLGFSPAEMQLIDLQRFSVEQIARLFSLPPVFLQDLTRGTFSNNEQQDLHFVKHTIKRWVEQVEQEMNLKMFGRGSSQYVEFSVDGLLRGDIKTRMEAHSKAIQNGIYTPAHAAKIENAPHHEEADKLFIQGGTMPIDEAELVPPLPTPPNEGADDDE
jgi:HK97 family phage portal protein